MFLPKDNFQLVNKATEGMNFMEGKFDILKEHWKQPIVPRPKVGDFSGGMLNPKTMANMDSLGIGPQTLKYNKRVFYRVDHLLEWMEQRDKAA